MSDGGFDGVECSACGAEFDTLTEMIQHAQIAHAVDVD